MSYLIDGSNLGGVVGGAAGSRDAAAVLRALLPWARRRARVVVFFDGAERGEVAASYGNVEVRFSAPISADGAILRFLGRGAKGWIVVTEDAALGRACRDLGARVQPASSLVVKARAAHREATASAEKPQPSSADAAYWHSLFTRRGDS